MHVPGRFHIALDSGHKHRIADQAGELHLPTGALGSTIRITAR